MESNLGLAHETTPSGETGTADLRDAQEGHGKGRVADAAGVHSRAAADTVGHGQGLDDDPTADDPYGSAAPRFALVDQDGPTYERGQGTANQSTGGSTDPNNSLTHANSGDETEMPDNVNTPTQAVDGYADTEGESNVASPDPGENKNADPLSPEEYAEAQKEARSEDDDK